MGQTYVYNSGETLDDVSELKIEIGVFFDGTLNNLKNTELRQKYKDGKNKIENTDSDEEILRKEQANKAKTDEQQKQYENLKNKDISEKDTVYERYLKSIYRDSMDKLGVDNSYSNDYTNVARMYQCSEEEYAIYIEGIGTLDNTRDVDDGFQYGSGDTGVRGKVRKGCEKLADRIDKLKRNLNNPKVKLKKLTIDTFGFSRGAAAARNFSYEINGKKRPKDVEIKKSKKEIGKEQIVDESGLTTITKYGEIWIDKDGTEVDPQYLVGGKLPKYGFLGYYLLSKGVLSPEELKDLKLEVRFIGVYDTVSSYEEFGNMSSAERSARGIIHSTMGSNHYFGNDVEQLQLKNPGPYYKAVHFTAMDEHRQNFALTTFPGSIEKELPGGHADIGGAYESGIETVDEIETSNNKILWWLNKRRKKLISQYWYKDDQIKINNKLLNAVTLGNVYRKITGTRFLRKEYSYIPLHFMEEHGEHYFKHKIITPTETSYSIKYEDNHFVEEKKAINRENVKYLQAAKDCLHRYVFGDGKPLYFTTDEEIKQKQEEERQKAENKARQEILDKEIRESKRQIPLIAQDKLRFSINRIPMNIPTIEEKIEPELDENGNPVITIDEIVIIRPTNQAILRFLRGHYLHWSADRDWVGMDPNEGYKRRIY